MRTEVERDLALADALQQPVWTARPDGTVDYANPFWRAYTGLSWEASIGGGWTNAVHPEDVAAIEACWREAASTGEAYEIEYRFRGANGTYRWHIARVAPVHEADGTVSRWVGTAIDIDDRRRAEAALRASEARYRDVVNNATDIVYTLLLDGTVSTVNPAIERVLGYRPEQVLGRSVEAIIAPEHLARTREVLGRKMAGEEVSAYDLDLVAKDGRRVTVEVNSRRATVDGQPVAIHGVARDVSERRALEREQQEVLEAISHDLKNPLTAVRGQAQHLRRLLRRDPPLPLDRLTTALEAIEASATRMQAQLDELQDLAQLRAGHPLELRPEPTDLAALVRQAAEEARATTGHHRIRVEAPATLWGRWDGLRLRRVLDNLLGNAVKYSPQGGRIEVTVAGGREKVVVRVRDGGMGIPAADLPYIFERYRRGGNVRGRIGGAGIGLAGSRQVVEQHGGTITVESVEGQGSTFTVTLPLESPEQPGSA